MKAVRLGVLVGVLVWATPARAQVDLPPALKEVVRQFEDESAEIEKKAEAELAKWRDRTATELKKVQDAFCKEAKLDEALAVRALIRTFQAGSHELPSGDLPPAVREVYKDHEQGLAEILSKANSDLRKRREKVADELRKVQDAYCKEAKLDEALAVRDMIRSVKEGVSSRALPDPGYVNNGQQDIGKVFYYLVTGATGGGSIYGTDIYTTGSHLAMATVHSGILKVGQKAVVKVTILPGQANYPSTTVNGITSSGWGAYNVSFKVERTFGLLLGRGTDQRDPSK
jgi:hypothetical protein